MNKKEILDILDNAKDEKGSVPMRLVRQALDKLPTIQPVATDTNVGDKISRQAAIDAIMGEYPDAHYPDWYASKIMALPSVQPEIIHCVECIYYDPPHVEKEDTRYEYSEMPKEAFDVLGTGLVSVEYGINIGGRCCVDYYCKNYSDDKRVYVPKDNYCGRAERRTDGSD